MTLVKMPKVPSVKEIKTEEEPLKDDIEKPEQEQVHNTGIKNRNFIRSDFSGGVFWT